MRGSGSKELIGIGWMLLATQTTGIEHYICLGFGVLAFIVSTAEYMAERQERHR